MALRITRYIQNMTLWPIIWPVYRYPHQYWFSRNNSDVKPVKDYIMQELRTASSAMQLLNTVANHTHIMNQKHIIQALTTLFQFYKKDRANFNTHEIKKNPTFNSLCHKILKYDFEITEVIEALKVLVSFNVPYDSITLQRLLILIQNKINHLKIQEIIFLDYILKPLEKCNTVSALTFALPLAFQIQQLLEFDTADVALLKSMLRFATKHELPERSINSIVTGLILHNRDIDANCAKSVVWSLCDTDIADDPYRTRLKLLHSCLAIMTGNIDSLLYTDILKTVAKMKEQIISKKHEEFYHEEFLNAVAKFVIVHSIDFERTLLIARMFSRIGYANIELIDYLSDMATTDPTIMERLKPNSFFSFVNCLSNANYQPKQWNEIKTALVKNPIMSLEKVSLPWTKFAVELAALDCYNDKLLNKIFNENFLYHYLARDNNCLDYQQLLLIQEAVKLFHRSFKGTFPPQKIIDRAIQQYQKPTNDDIFTKSLATCFGERCFLTNVRLPNGMIVDYMLTVNKDNRPVTVPLYDKNSGEILSFHDLKLSSDCQIIIILVFSKSCYTLNSRKLRGMYNLIVRIVEGQVPNSHVLPVSWSEWAALSRQDKDTHLSKGVASICLRGEHNPIEQSRID